MQKPRFTRKEKESIKLLNLEAGDLNIGGHLSLIKSAYKKMAKIYHPDMGGDAEKFKKLNEAHQQMLSWAENPQFTSRKALAGCWSFDSSTNRWTPPL
ncbi:MAG: DnaJ domain-containing protein [Deltaproteobacteria bacterium]|nr:DnaJ domain-containing protein [Deltaproteobacteria bacterium]